MIHTLKCDPDIFQKIWNKEQTFELRLNDRNYKVGDEIISHETTHTGEEMEHGMKLEYTGRYICSKIVGILQRNHFSKDRFDNWVIISIQIMKMGVEESNELQSG